jgi:tRNA-specific 2-thiouridylase
MLNFAISVGADYVATGHYAINEYQNNRRLLKMARDRKKDQSYFLYRLTHNQLNRIIFPLGNITKEEVKNIAKEYELDVYRKRESHEICFIPDGDYASFIEKNIKEDMSGRIVRSDGKVLGRHRGFFHYTIGQRRGLKISDKNPIYVVKINPQDKDVIVGYENELYASKFVTRENNFILDVNEIENLEGLKVKIRYLSDLQDCKIKIDRGDKVYVNTSVPLRAITPGQSAVFYLDDIVVGGGIIDEVIG